MAETTEATDSTFAEVVLASATPVIVEFWAPWCAPCRMIAPHLEKVLKELGDKVKSVRVNTDDNPDLLVTYNIRSIPTIMVVRDGQVYGKILGYRYESVVRRELRRFLTAKAPQAPV